jgi:hypothetical protein
VLPERPALERRIIIACEASPSRIPVLVGGCGSGRTSLLLRVSDQLGAGHGQYIDAERAASTPESFWAAIADETPYVADTKSLATGGHRSARLAFDRLLSFFEHARSQDGGPSTFLIDELLELRTFESFPGLRGALREFITMLPRSSNRFVLATRYANRATRFLRDLPERVELIPVPPLSLTEITSTLLRVGVGRDIAERTELARLLHTLTGGRPVYVQALAKALDDMDGASGGDPVSALASQLAVGAPLSQACRLCYEIRLSRARGYGALKAILHVLADKEDLTLTEIAHRLGRTPGSTKDYLSWLEDVDLIQVQQKRYSYFDPLLRLWVRLHSHPTPPDESDLSREAQEYAVARLPFMEPAPPIAEAPTAATEHEVEPDRAWSLIEID